MAKNEIMIPLQLVKDLLSDIEWYDSISMVYPAPKWIKHWCDTTISNAEHEHENPEIYK